MADFDVLFCSLTNEDGTKESDNVFTSDYEDTARFIYRAKLKHQSILITDVWSTPVIVATNPNTFIDEINSDYIDPVQFVDCASPYIGAFTKRKLLHLL